MLIANDLYKRFAEVRAVNGVSFKLGKGTILGVLGKNGAGKSTIFRIILGILEADKGSYTLDSKKYNLTDSKKIGFLPEEGSLSHELTVYEQLSFYGSLKEMSEDMILESTIKWLKKFDIVDYMNKRIKELSKGNRQRIQFIVSVLHDPEYLILDEPFSGVDPLGVELFKEILLELKKEGKAIIFSSHRMEHVELFCDDILLIDEGITLCYGNLEEIKEKYPKQKLVIKENKNKIEKILSTKDIEKYKKINKGENIKVEKLSLNDIFIDKVGEHDDK
ncbi:MAG: ATP-binding cassette domain-containing protein [Clostridia bacterium]|nr:ATP-binding cassette domain-containing protein [Clostridia bacterium]MDD4376100.1 ATP-binding cassette domain-containing protein [Clostridia bacterium]